MEILKLTDVETKKLLRFDSVEVCRNGQWYIVEKEYYCDGYRISALCEYNAVKLYEDLNKG